MEFNQLLYDRVTEFPELNPQELRDYIQLLDSKNLPAIISYKQLAEIFELKDNIVLSMAYGQRSFYRSFFIPKRDGKTRKIDAPFPSLALIQRWITTHIINQLDIDNDSVTAYRKNHSIKDHVFRHANSNYILKLDLKNFFPSIKLSMVHKIFSECGYRKDVASLISHFLTLDGSLPQGAPSSPLLCNVIARNLDKILKEYCDTLNLKYTRYADDLVISGDEISNENISEIQKRIESEKFYINYSKFKLYNPNESVRHLTGLVINNGAVSIPRKTRRKIRQSLYYIDKYLIKDIKLRDNTSNKYNIFINDPIAIDRLNGYLNFWLWIEPNSKFAYEAKLKISKIIDRLQN